MPIPTPMSLHSRPTDGVWEICTRCLQCKLRGETLKKLCCRRGEARVGGNIHKLGAAIATSQPASYDDTVPSDNTNKSLRAVVWCGCCSSS
uniref:Uncharacterized protein n=1 Tax=Physcomitrium patens TaxID=3218 RepID=A0A2K1JVS0_PHYPA|nr:hypothetical protein PHYPA_015389 [Physcomitrium patens]